MGEFKNLLRELKQTLRKILAFDIFIETLLVFLGLYLFFMIFNLSIYFSIMPAIAYFIFMMVRRRNLTSIRAVEEKYPILNEALRTVKDTLSEDNYLIKELRSQVKSKVRNVSASSFMDLKGDILKIVICIVLVFAILSISVCKGTSDTCNTIFSKTDIPKAVERIDLDSLTQMYQEYREKAEQDTSANPTEGMQVKAQQLMIGDDTQVKLGDDKLKLKIRLASDQIDINDVNEQTTEKEFVDMDIGKIDASVDQTFEEEISREHKEIVKNYFDTINKD